MFSLPLGVISLDYLTIGLGLLVLMVFVIMMFLASRYRRCPSNRILCVFGRVSGGTSVKTYHGGGAFVWPLIQDYKYMDLTPMAINIPLKNALSLQNIRVNVPSVFTIAIDTTNESMQQAAIRLLDLNQREIEAMATEIIVGQLRLTVASLTIEQINQDREKFLELIRHNVETELCKIGLYLINVNITDITDESGYIEAIGQKAASQAVQQARGDVAEQEKIGEVRVMQAQRDKDIQVSLATKNRQIGTREAIRDQGIRVAELEKEQKVGEQAAVFLREAQVKDAEQAMRISIAEANAKAAVGEQSAQFAQEVQVKEAERAKRVAVATAQSKAVEGELSAQGTIVASQAAFQVKQAEAYQLGETRKREAEASVLEAQHRALTRAALAEADRVEAERRAALEAVAKAEKAKVIVDAEAQAEQKRIQAEGEAKAIYAKLEAEARGQYEILAKKGEGMKMIVDACGGADKAFQLLFLDHLDKLAETSAKAISNIKFDKIVVWEGGGGGGKNGQGSATANFLGNLAHTLPPMLHVMKDIGGVQVPEFLAKLQSGEMDGGAGAGATTVKPVAPVGPSAPASPAHPESSAQKPASPSAPGASGPTKK